MTYTLIAREPHYTHTQWDEDMMECRREIKDKVHGEEGSYWIESNQRDVKLVVPTFMDGEELITRLSDSGDLESMEDAEKVLDEAEIVDSNPY